VLTVNNVLGIKTGQHVHVSKALRNERGNTFGKYSMLHEYKLLLALCMLSFCFVCYTCHKLLLTHDGLYLSVWFP